MKKYSFLIALFAITSFISCKNEQRTTPDGTLVDTNEGHSEEVLDNRGGQSQMSDTTNHNTVPDKTGIQDSVSTYPTK